MRLQVSCSADSEARGCPLLDAAAATLRAGRGVRAELLIRSLADQGAPLCCAAALLVRGPCRLRTQLTGGKLHAS